MRFYIQSIVVGVISLAVVAGAAGYVRTWELDRQKRDFSHAAEAYHQLLGGRLRNIILELDSAQRFFHASHAVNRDEFSTFVSKIVDSSPEILAVSWTPAGEEPQGVVSFPVRFSEPADKMQSAIGVNLAEDPEILSLLEQARDEGVVVPITGANSVARLAGSRLMSGVTLVQPVYRTSKKLSTIRERREAHLGFLLLQYDIGIALEAALKDLRPQGFDMYVVDVEAETGSEIVHHHPSRLKEAGEARRLNYDELWTDSPFIYKTALDVTGRQWKLAVVPVEAFFEARREYQSMIVLGFGAVLSLLLFYLLYSHQRRARDIQAIVETRTRELENSETKQRAVVENIAEGIITINEAGEIETFNRAAEIMFGYEASEVIGKSVGVIVPSHERRDHDTYIRNSTLTNSRIINKSRDLFGQTKDGRLIPIELNVSRMFLNGEIKYVGIMHDISERVKTQEILKASKEMAEKASQAKSEFLSSMSHELRTPLNAILGFGQMLDMNAKEPLSARQKECVTHIMRGGRHLLNLINDVLDLAKIEAGRVVLSIDVVSPGKVVSECLTLIAPLAEDKGVALKLPAMEGEWPNIWADHTRLKQVLLNLLSNAVKYNRPEGSVTLSVGEVEGGRLRFKVSDTGFGIPKDRQRDLFKPFHRLDAENSEIEGTGIGLVITKDLVELMDGTIGLESEEGRGSVFWIDMPLAAGSQAAAVLRKGETRKNKLEGERPVNGTLLYVEDNPENLKLMELIVGKIEGLSMVSAHTGELGLEMARASKPDLIILDINLPGMSGLELVRRLKKDAVTAQIPVLALSAAATQNDIDEGLKAGFDRYLTKPVIVPEVLDAIETVLVR